MSNFSGVDGTVLAGSSEVCEVRRWTFDENAAVPEWGSNKSGGYKKSIGGTKSGAGSFDYVMDDAAMLANSDYGITAGASVTLLLKVDDNTYLTVPATIRRIGTNVQVDDQGDPVGGPVEFVANGAWSWTNS